MLFFARMNYEHTRKRLTLLPHLVTGTMGRLVVLEVLASNCE